MVPKMEVDDGKYIFTGSADEQAKKLRDCFEAYAHIRNRVHRMSQGIPSGCHFQVTLEDGTVVDLNTSQFKEWDDALSRAITATCKANAKGRRRPRRTDGTSKRSGGLERARLVRDPQLIRFINEVARTDSKLNTLIARLKDRRTQGYVISPPTMTSLVFYARRLEDPTGNPLVPRNFPELHVWTKEKRVNGEVRPPQEKHVVPGETLCAPDISVVMFDEERVKTEKIDAPTDDQKKTMKEIKLHLASLKESLKKN